MFNISKSIIFNLTAVILAISAVKSLPSPSRADINIQGVTYKYKYNAENIIKSASPNDHLRLIKFDGEQSKYNMTADYTYKQFQSTGICSFQGNPKQMNSVQFSGPCTVSTKLSSQNFTVSCKDDKESNVTFTLLPIDGNDKNPDGITVEAITWGKAKVAFIENGKQTDFARSNNADEPLTSKVPDAGVAINCNNVIKL